MCITSLTRPLSIWSCDWHPPILARTVLSMTPRRFDWPWSPRGLRRWLRCRLHSDWTFRCYRCHWRYSGSGPCFVSWVNWCDLRTLRDTRILGKESIRCHAEIRHKLDQKHIATGNNGSAKESGSRQGMKLWIDNFEITLLDNRQT